MINDSLITLKDLIGKRVCIHYYVGNGNGLQIFHQVGWIREVSNHEVILEPDPSVVPIDNPAMDQVDIPIVMTTLLTEFVAIYAVDELAPDKTITEGK